MSLCLCTSHPVLSVYWSLCLSTNYPVLLVYLWLCMTTGVLSCWCTCHYVCAQVVLSCWCTVKLAPKERLWDMKKAPSIKVFALSILFHTQNKHLEVKNHFLLFQYPVIQYSSKFFYICYNVCAPVVLSRWRICRNVGAPVFIMFVHQFVIMFLH